MKDNLINVATKFLRKEYTLKEAAQMAEPPEADLLRKFKKEFDGIADANTSGSDYIGYDFNINSQRAKRKLFAEIGVESSYITAMIPLYTAKGNAPVKSTLIEMKFEDEEEEDNYYRAVDMLDAYKKEFDVLMKKYPQVQLHHTPWDIFAYTKVKSTGEYIHIDLYA